MEIELIIDKYLSECRNGNITFRQAMTEIDRESTNYRLSYFSEEYAIFTGFKTKRSFKVQNVSVFEVEDSQLEEILKEVSKASDISIEAIKNPSRKREIVEARHAYCILAMQLTKKSLKQIGDLINREHATVLHAKSNAHIPEIQQIIAKTGLL